MKRLIVLDTNLLLAAVQFRFDLSAELERIRTFDYTLATLDQCVHELEKLAQSKGKTKQEAQLAIALLHHLSITPLEGRGKYADDSLLLFANAIIATVDAQLIKKLIKLKRPYITVRQKKYLTLEGDHNL